MNRILPIFSLVCCVLFNANFAHSADLMEKSTFRISSNPSGASVFHYLRGKNYFLGYTPLDLSRNELVGKENTKIRLIKFGYQETLHDLAVDGKDKIIALKPEQQPYLKIQGDPAAGHSKCAAEIEKKITDIIRKSITSQLALQFPFLLAETGKGVEVRIMSNLLSHSDIRNIEKIGRKDKEETVAFVGQLVSPVASQLINIFEKLGCMDVLVIVAAYQDKGLKVDFTPYLDHWSQYTEQIVGNTKYTTIVYGTKVELYSGMVQTKKDKSFLFEYRLH